MSLGFKECAKYERIGDLLTAFENRCEECCTLAGECKALLPVDRTTLCGDGNGLIEQLHVAVASASQQNSPTGCYGIQFSEDYPWPPLQDCITGDFVDAMYYALINASCHTPAYECAKCLSPHLLPQTWILELAGGTDRFEWWNGTHYLPLNEGSTSVYQCQWYILYDEEDGTNFIRLEAYYKGHWYLRFQHGHPNPNVPWQNIYWSLYAENDPLVPCQAGWNDMTNGNEPSGWPTSYTLTPFEGDYPP